MGKAGSALSKSIGDQIRDAVQEAVSSQDFSQLQSAIEQSIGAAADNVGKGLAQASNSILRAQQDYATEQQRRQANFALAQQQRAAELAQQSIYAKPGPSRATGIAQTAGGTIIALPFFFTGLIGILAGDIVAGLVLLLVAAGGLALMQAGIRRLDLTRRFERYRNIIGMREFCYISELSARTGETPKSILKRVKQMIAKGLFKQAALDDPEACLIMTSDAYRRYRAARLEAANRQHQQALAQSVTEPSEQHGATTPEVQAFLDRGKAYVAKIRLSNEAIPGEQISRKLDQIEHVVNTILERAEEQPEVIDDLEQLMNYYLPTTVKLLDAYRELDEQPIQGENIQKSKREIENALDSLNVAFEKLLDSIFRDMTWDVSADISVLHTVLSQEGLVKSPFDTKTC